MTRFKNILVVRTDRMGDVVLTTPAIKALREAYPSARISVLVAPYTKAILEKNPFINEILIDDRKKTHRGFLGFWRLVLDLRKKRFDAAIVFHTKRRTNLLCFFAGIPYRLGYKNDKFGFLLTDPVADERHHGRRHEAQYCLDLVRHLGGLPSGVLSKSPADLVADVHVSILPDAEMWVDALLKKEGIQPTQRLIAIHPGASDPAKQWPEHSFVQLIEQLENRYPGTIILVGSEHVGDVAHRIATSVRVPVLDLTGKTATSQFASLLKRCALLISNDSGPVHLAAGVGTPVVSIFTRNQPGINPTRWQPLGARSKVVSVPPDSRISFRKAGPAGPKYMETIPAQDVLEAVDAIFKLC